MANKRMFTMKIVDSDAFLEMPLSTQCLYFHLNMRADDDGFIGNPKRIMRIVGASEDDLKLLIAKRFLLSFDDGVIVIKHWRMHNTLSQNRYHETQYVDEKSMLKLKDNGSYSFINGQNIDDKKLIESKKEYDKNSTACKRLDNGLQTADSDLDLDIDLELDKDIDNNIYSCAEPNMIVTAPPIISLILNDKTYYEVTKDDYDEWVELYPAVNVMQELRNMKGWCDSNPTKRKTRRGIKRFINAWLTKEQDRGGKRSNTYQNQTAQMLSESYDMMNEWVKQKESEGCYDSKGIRQSDGGN